MKSVKQILIYGLIGIGFVASAFSVNYYRDVKSREIHGEVVSIKSAETLNGDNWGNLEVLVDGGLFEEDHKRIFTFLGENKNLGLNTANSIILGMNGRYITIRPSFENTKNGESDYILPEDIVWTGQKPIKDKVIEGAINYLSKH